MKLVGTITLLGVILGALLIGGCSFPMASDVPSDETIAPSCMWSDVVMDVDDYMLGHLSASADIYLEVQEKGEAAAKATFLSNLYSEKVSDDCAGKAWDWVKQAYLKFQEPGHDPMDAEWLNGS